MRDVEGAQVEVSAEAIQGRLQHAYKVLFNLPSDGGQRLKVATYGYVSELVSVAGKLARIRLNPSRLDIELMDEALVWPSLIPNLTTRRIVSARSMVHPVTDRPVFNWQRLSKALDADVRAIKRWHMEGLCVIGNKLLDMGL